MIIASDPQFYLLEIPKDSAILRNKLVAGAMNQILDLGRWPAQSSRLTHGYDAPIIDPSGVIVNGDLTHTFMRKKHQAFIEWRNSIQWDMYPGLGNHDVMDSGYYVNSVFGLLNLGFGDYERSRKEAVWWMANLIETEAIPNIVNRNLRGFVGLEHDLFSLRYDAARIGIRFWAPVGPGDSMLVSTWSEWIKGGALGLSRWGFLRIPDKAIAVDIQCHNFWTGESVPVRSFPAPEPWQAQCYRLYSTLGGPEAETRSRPREWPDGNIGSLAYSYDIGPYYHFVQLHHSPLCKADLPSRWIPLAISNADDAFHWDHSPALEWQSSIEWLKADLAAATEAGKYIVINYHGSDISGYGITPEVLEAFEDRNVVAIFYGHYHELFVGGAYQLNTYNDSTYYIASYCSGSTNYLKFLLTMFHRTYFNVSVVKIDDTTGQQTFDTYIEVLPRIMRPPLNYFEGDTLDFSGGWYAETFMIPEMFLADADPAATDPIAGANGDGGAILYGWHFGDGIHSTDENPFHVYRENGEYTVTLTVDDQQGMTGTATWPFDGVREVRNAAPTATIDSILGPVGNLILPGQEASFYGSFSDPGYLDSHTARWDFGDGNIEPGTIAEENEVPDATGTVSGTHVYGQSGTFTAVLYVQDDDGAADTATIDVMVMSPIEPKLVGQIDSVIQSLPASCFKGPAEQHKKALSNKLAAVEKSVASGSLEGAINKLTNDIRAKMDGFVDGKPQDDWIKDEEAQVELCGLIDELIDYLKSGGPAGTESDPAASAEDSGYDGERNLPAEFSLSQNKPNPFNAATLISFRIPHATYVTLEIFNVKGQKLVTLVNRQLEAGEHVYEFDGSDIASGIYIYRLQAGDHTEARKMLLLK